MNVKVVKANTVKLQVVVKRGDLRVVKKANVPKAKKSRADLDPRNANQTTKRRIEHDLTNRSARRKKARSNK